MCISAGGTPTDELSDSEGLLGPGRHYSDSDAEEHEAQMRLRQEQEEATYASY